MTSWGGFDVGHALTEVDVRVGQPLMVEPQQNAVDPQGAWPAAGETVIEDAFQTDMLDCADGHRR